jgi:hypothetical protein
VAAVPAEPLEWLAFCAAYFPARRRHDFEALVAYGAYRRSGGVDTPPASEPDVTTNGAESRAALEAWEDEGGPVT